MDAWVRYVPTYLLTYGYTREENNNNNKTEETSQSGAKPKTSIRCRSWKLHYITIVT